MPLWRGKIKPPVELVVGDLDTGLPVDVSSSRPDFSRVQVCYFYVTIIMITQESRHKAI